jgi:ABC-type nitrate/sulfonate/bicarbonate transport system permease component
MWYAIIAFIVWWWWIVVGWLVCPLFPPPPEQSSFVVEDVQTIIKDSVDATLPTTQAYAHGKVGQVSGRAFGVLGGIVAGRSTVLSVGIDSAGRWDRQCWAFGLTVLGVGIDSAGRWDRQCFA